MRFGESSADLGLCGKYRRKFALFMDYSKMQNGGLKTQRAFSFEEESP